MKFEIWSEGYWATGDKDSAGYHGEWEGETFADACEAWASNIQHPEYFNKSRLTYWGCRLFDNEIDARKTFG